MPIRVQSAGITGVESQTAGQESERPATRQQRILQLMRNGDLIWEVAEQDYRTLYNEKRGRDQRIPAAVVAVLEQQGWIRRLDHSSAGRLDGWELTPEGRTLALSKRATRAGEST
jgi:hypothetical protein